MNDEACSVRRDIIIEFLVKPRQDSNSGRGEFWAAAAAASEKNPRRAKLGLHELFSCKKKRTADNALQQSSLEKIARFYQPYNCSHK